MQVVYKSNVDFVASYENLAQPSSLTVADITQKGILWFRFKDTKTIFQIFPSGKIQVKWNNMEEKKTLLKLAKNLLVAKDGEKLWIKPDKQQVWIPYPVPESFRLYWCDEQSEYQLHSSDGLRIFSSEYELKRAFAHSWKLFEMKLNMPTCYNLTISLSSEDRRTKKLLYQHFESGYEENIWKPLQEYLRLIKENNVTVGPIPEIGFLPLVTGFVVYPKPSNGPCPRRIPNVPFSRPSIKPKEPNEHVNPKIMERLIQLQKILLKESYFIRTQLENGIPLKGGCDCCPGRAISVRRK